MIIDLSKQEGAATHILDAESENTFFTSCGGKVVGYVNRRYDDLEVWGIGCKSFDQVPKAIEALKQTLTKLIIDEGPYVIIRRYPIIESDDNGGYVITTRIAVAKDPTSFQRRIGLENYNSGFGS